MIVTSPTAPAFQPAPLDLPHAASMQPADVLAALGSTPSGMTSTEAAARLTTFGPNVIRSHGARPLAVLVRQVKNPLLPILMAAAVISLFVGDRASAVIILVIVAISTALGFVNEFRSEQAVEALHSHIRHTAVTLRDGVSADVDVTGLVPGDVVRLRVGDVVPADVRILDSNGLTCDEAVLTGESLPAAKTAAAQPADKRGSALDLTSCAFMGTVVKDGDGTAVVVDTGTSTEFGRIAMRLGDRPAETAFQAGLRDFSRLLVAVTLILSVSIFIINAALGHGVLDAALFALAIAVGLTPELMPAIVTVSLSTGARRLAKRSVVVKRLVSIEDLGNIEILFTDKTGTLTEGRITFAGAFDLAGQASNEVLRLGLLCNAVATGTGGSVGGDELDRALVGAPQAADLLPKAKAAHVLSSIPFDHDRRMSTVLVDADGTRTIVTKGAPESVVRHCVNVPPASNDELQRLFADGWRVVAVATKAAAQAQGVVTQDDESGLALAGFLTFNDPPKQGVGQSLAMLAKLGVIVKIVTGDNEVVAAKLCRDLGLQVDGVLTGLQMEPMDDASLTEAVKRTTVFGRVSPEQKSRIIKAARSIGEDVAFMGDGVNDAVALHDADVGISVDTAADVAKDAADIVLLEKDLGVLAEGVMEGRRIFANTIKYVLMATSSNFGNMFSAAGASLFLDFLPMLPTQILLNNLLYDASQTAIPTDNVDQELLERPSHWDTRFIRKFMAFFGPISSAYDFVTFGVMLWGFHAGEKLFHTGWFVESLATQTLVIFVIRTRRVPFWRSKPSLPLIVTVGACALVGVVLPYTPLAGPLGFVPLPASFLLILCAMIVTYLAVAEVGVAYFFRHRTGTAPLAHERSRRNRRVHRFATRWSHAGPVPMRAGVAS